MVSFNDPPARLQYRSSKQSVNNTSCARPTFCVGFGAKPAYCKLTVGNLTQIPSPRAVTAGLLHGLTLSSRVSSGDASSHSSSCACGGRVYVVVIALQLRVCTAVVCLVITLAEGATHTKGRERNV